MKNFMITIYTSSIVYILFPFTFLNKLINRYLLSWSHCNTLNFLTLQIAGLAVKVSGF